MFENTQIIFKYFAIGKIKKKDFCPTNYTVCASDGNLMHVSHFIYN